MPEVQKYSLKEELEKKDAELTDSPSLYGMSALTYARYINSMRSVMFCSHLKQYLVPLNPDFPLVFTNSENIVGENSDGYKRVDNECEVIHKVVKYEDILDEPNRYELFIFDRVRKRYDVISRSEIEDLTENFGYEYNNDVIDGLEEGDTIPPKTVLYKSTSYDEEMNYCFGINATTMYTLDPYTSEDAAVVSRSFAERFKTIEVVTFNIKLNDNDYLLNLRGEDGEYKPLPDIGEYADGLLACIRTQFNAQLLHDFSAENLRRPFDSDRKIYTTGKVQIVDYTIYNNNEEIVDTPFNALINKYLRSQNAYWQDIHDTCEWIKNSGYEYSKQIEYLYSRSNQVLNPKTRWKEGDSAFSNMSIEIVTRKVKPLSKGQKITGRYGNKSVISQIREDDEMPYTEDGTRVDLLLNLFAIINRTTSFVIYEMVINSICRKARKYMATLKTLKQKENLLFELINDFNEDQCAKMRPMYNMLDDKDKEELIQETIDNGILIHQSPIHETKAIFYRVMDVLDKYDWLMSDIVYINQNGRKIKTMSRHWVGELLIMKLKQSDQRGFSVRSTGAIDIRDLPVRSYKSRQHMEKHSDTAVRFGEFETLNFSIGVPSEDIALLHALYRTSPKARADFVKNVFKSNKDKFKFDKYYVSRVAELFGVMLKSLGCELDFVDTDTCIEGYDNTNLTTHVLDDGTTMLCTDYEFMMHQRRKEVEEEVLMENLLLTSEQLEKEVNKRLKDTKFLTGPMYDEDGNVIAE